MIYWEVFADFSKLFSSGVSVCEIFEFAESLVTLN